MNKQLWKAIGLERKSFSISNISECSTIKLADGPNEVLNENSHDDDYPFNSGNPQRVKKVKSNNLPQMKLSQKAQDYGGMEIQMCQSESQKQQENTVKDCIQQKKQYLKNKINSLLLQVVLLRQENDSFKKIIKVSLQSALKSMIQQYEVLQIQIEDKSNSVPVKCTKCDKSKKMVQRLTRQCWDLTQKLKDQTTKNGQLSRNIESKRKDQSNPLRKIQEGLLFERGQSIRKVKARSQQLQLENQTLKNTLQNNKINIQIMEIKYKQHLKQFQKQLQDINEYMAKKIEDMANSKHLLQSQLIALNRKYSSLQFQHQIIKSKKISTEQSYPYVERSHKNYPVTRQQSNNHNLNLSHKQSLKGLKYLQKINFPTNNKPFYPQASTSNFNVNLNKSNQIHNSVSYLPNNKLFKRKQLYQKTEYSNSSRRQSDILINETKSISFNLVMDRLTDLQRQVQKEIKRSKISNK